MFCLSIFTKVNDYLYKDKYFNKLFYLIYIFKYKIILIIIMYAPKYNYHGMLLCKNYNYHINVS